ncbi:MAG: hypothetical protein ACRD3F_13985 [Acidobacteriaceae bacterium]
MYSENAFCIRQFSADIGYAALRRYRKKRGGAQMGGLIGVLVGLALAVFGFFIMRSPMCLALLSPWSKGYCQRLVLDTGMRNQLRVLGVLICLFGAGISTDALGALLKTAFINSISEGLWALMALIFFAAFGFGLILTVVQLFRGQLFDWFRLWRESAQLGAIDVFPPITPKMRREANLFTAVLVSLACLAAAASLLR